MYRALAALGLLHCLNAQTIYYPEATTTQAAEFSVISGPSGSIPGIFQVVQSAASGSAAEETATLVNGPSTFSYYASDAAQGANYEVCSISDGVAYCVESDATATSSFSASYGAVTTLNGAESGAATATGSAAGGLPTGAASLPSCALTCSIQTIGTGGCDTVTDITCVCTSAAYQSAVYACYQSACTPAELQSAVAYGAQLCSNNGTPINTSNTPAAASST